MDPLSLSALGAVGLGHAFKFLFDRASAALDRRAQRRAENEGPNGGEHAGPDAERPTAAVPGEAEAVADVAAPMRVLEVYRSKGLDLDPSDGLLVETLHQVHAALERLEGRAIDLRAAVESLIRVEQQVDDVRGRVVGVESGERSPQAGVDVTQRMNTVHEGGSVIGFRFGVRDA